MKTYKIMLLVVLALFLGGTYFLFKYYSADQLVTPVKIDSKDDISEEPTESTKWKKGTLEKLELTFSYPEYLFFTSSEPNPGSDITAYIQNYSNESPNPKPVDDMFQMYIFSQYENKTSDEEFDKLGEGTEFATVRKIKVDGYDAWTGQYSGERNRYVTIINKDGVLINVLTSQPTLENEKLANEIIETFDFK